jgi:hypothetical protein
VTKKRQTFSVYRSTDSVQARKNRAEAFGNTVPGLIAQEAYVGAHRIMDEHGGVTPASVQAVANSASVLLYQMAPAMAAKSQAACKAGCCWCCYQPVAVWPLEVFALAEWLRANRTIGELGVLQERLREDGAERDRQRAEGRRTTRVRCALLGLDDRCTAYSMRPSACIGCNASDAAQCEAWVKGDDNAGGLYNGSQVAMAVAITKGTAAALTHRGGPAAGEVDFHSALLAALEGREGALEAWLGGADLLAEAARRLSASQTLKTKS